MPRLTIEVEVKDLLSKIDTKKLLRMSLQTTHAGKEELKALACQSGVAWKEIDHTKEEKSRIQLQRNFRIAVMRFPVSEPVNQAAVMALVHCALKHISQIDESGLDSSHILKRAWFHSV